MRASCGILNEQSAKNERKEKRKLARDRGLFVTGQRTVADDRNALLRRLAVASHAVAIHGRLRGLKIAVAPLRCFGITFLNRFISRHRHRRVGSRSCVRFRSLSLLRKGLRSRGNDNRSDYQKREGLHEKSPLHDLGASQLT